MTEILGERLNGEPSDRANRCAQINRRLPMPWDARNTALVAVLLGLVVGNLLVLSTPVVAATKSTKHVAVITPITASTDTSRVSPYTIANRQHAAARAEHAPTTAPSVRRQQNMNGQRH